MQKNPIMKHLPLDIYDDMPRAMKVYLNSYGFHFNKKAYELAVRQMKRKSAATDKEEPVEPYTKDQIEDLLVKNNIKLEGGEMYDAAYVATMCKADYLKSSVPDEMHLAMYVKDTLDDIDGSDELPFRFWLQKCVAMGKPIEWESLL